MTKQKRSKKDTPARTEQKKYKYLITLKESIQAAYKNPAVFIPTLISSLLGILSIPLIVKMQNQAFIFENIAFSIITFSLVAAAGIILSGWSFSMLNQLLTKGKISIKTSFKRCISFGLRVWAIYILAALAMLPVYIAVSAITGILLYISKIAALSVIAIALGVIIGALFLVFTFLYLTAVPLSIPVIITEDKKVMDTITTAVKFYFKKKLFSLNIFLMSATVLAISYIPYALYYLSLMAKVLATAQSKVLNASQLQIMALLTLLPNLLIPVIKIYYSKSYLIKRETIKK